MFVNDMITAIAAFAAGTVLVLSGTLKLGREPQLRRSFILMGLPTWSYQSGWLSRCIPIIEVALGLLIVSTTGRPFLAAQLATVLLFGLFTLVVGRVVLAKTAVSCECFGGLANKNISVRTVVRNVLLTVLASVGLLGQVSPASAASHQWGRWAYLVPLAAPLILTAALLLYRKIQQHHERRLLVKKLTLSDAQGQTILLTELASSPTYLVFLSPTCGPCERFIERFRWFPHAIADGFDIVPVLVSDPARAAAAPAFRDIAPHALYDPERSVANAVRQHGAPAVVLVDAKNPLGYGSISGAREIEKYVVREGFYDEVS